MEDKSDFEGKNHHSKRLKNSPQNEVEMDESLKSYEEIKAIIGNLDEQQLQSLRKLLEKDDEFLSLFNSSISLAKDKKWHFRDILDILSIASLLMPFVSHLFPIASVPAQISNVSPPTCPLNGSGSISSQVYGTCEIPCQPITSKPSPLNPNYVPIMSTIRSSGATKEQSGVIAYCIQKTKNLLSSVARATSMMEDVLN